MRHSEIAAQNMQALRLRHGVSRSSLMRYMNKEMQDSPRPPWRRDTAQRIEDGLRFLTIDELCALSRILNVSLTDLVGIKAPIEQRNFDRPIAVTIDEIRFLLDGMEQIVAPRERSA